LCPEFFRGTHHIGGYGLLDRCQLGQALAKHAAAADLLLRWVRLLQLQARLTAQLSGRLFDHNTELLAQHPRVGLGQIHGGFYAQGIQVQFHLAANAPHLRHSCIAQHPIAFDWIGNVDHTTRLRLQSFRRVVRQLRQSLGVSDTNTDRNTSTAKHLCPNLSAQRIKITNASQISKRLIDAVHLNRRHHRLDQAHHALAHVAVQRIVGRERHNALLLELVLDLEIRLAHLDERLRVITTSDYAAIVVAQHHNGHLRQVWPEYALAAGIEAVAVDQCKGWFLLRHGCAPCW